MFIKSGMIIKSGISLGALALVLAASSTHSEEPSPALVEMTSPALLSSTICGRDAHGANRAAGIEVASLSAFLTSLSPEATAAVPFFEGLGDLTYPISTKSELAQRYFDQGLKLAYNFNHMEAIRSFRAAQMADKTCAMCYWGEAWALGPNINAPMDKAAYTPAYVALQKAIEHKDKASAKEQALIEALSHRYGPDIVEDRGPLDVAFAEAMKDVFATYGDDDVIGGIYVEAAMDTTPWNYWEENRYTPRPQVAHAIITAERLLARNPLNPVAIHLYIHLTEASSAPKRAEPHADRLAALMPGAGHLVHMPSHTYYRIGRYVDSLKTNINAVAADEAYLARVKAEGLYPLGYYPHNVHFVLVSAVMAGDVDTALQYAKKLDAVLPLEAASAQAWIQPIKVAPYFAYAKFGAVEDVMTLPDPGDSLPFVQAIWHYALAEAAIRGQDFDTAQEHAQAIADLRKNADFSNMLAGNVPALDILGIAHLTIKARLAQEQDDLDTAISYWEEAASLQDRLVYTEPPYWYYPVRQSLGAALLAAGDPDGAVKAFQAALIEAPNNGWSLYGLSEAYKAMGEEAMSKATRAHLATSWAGDMDALSRDRL